MASKNGNCGTVRVKVSDFGPIASADIELRPLTILIGPSNSGKSYFATLVYALSKCLNERHRMLARPSLQGSGRHRRPTWAHKLCDDTWARLTKKERGAFAAWVRNSVATSSDGARSPTPPPSMLRKVVRNAHERLWQSDSSIEPCLEQCFGLDDMRALKRNRSRKFPRIGVSIGEGQGSAGTRLDISLVPGDATTTLAISPDVSLAEIGKLPPQLRGLSPDSLGKGVGSGALDEDTLRLTFVNACLSGALPLSQLARHAHYLPADRSGIMHAHKVVAGALLNHSARGGMREQPPPLLRGVVGDFLQEMTDMPGSKGPFHNLGKDIETGILDGDLHVEKSPGTGCPSFLFQPRDWAKEKSVPLTNASATVSELAPVVLSIRHTVREGDLVVIEEPEAHLHPDKQAELAFHIAKLVRRGVKVLVTTHSLWVLEKFVNLMGTSMLTAAQKAKVAKGHSLIEGASLRIDQVGAWLFCPRTRPSGSVVREVAADFESGCFDTEFMDVFLQLYSEWEHIHRWRIAKAA